MPLLHLYTRMASEETAIQEAKLTRKGHISFKNVCKSSTTPAGTLVLDDIAESIVSENLQQSDLSDLEETLSLRAFATPEGKNCHLGVLDLVGHIKAVRKRKEAA